MTGAHQAPRGTYDLLPEDAARRRRIVSAAHELLAGAGFGEIETPIFEDTELFARTVGEATDIVSKEMYTFTDRGDRSMTLRPEGTAPVCRAYVQHGMHKLPQPVKLWYAGPMFRYEAPQSGRFRQHSQIGAEVIGSDDPAVDAELIDLLGRLYERVGLDGARLHLSSIGSAAARAEYMRELRDFLLASGAFDAAQRARIETNPMRAFDWDGERERAVTGEAPKMIDRLGDEDRAHFEQVRRLLDAAGIEYQIDPRLVRGLDYYTRTVFEFRSDALGAQSGVGGGGRYDRLVEQVGGAPTPAAGWATGLERIAQAAAAEGAGVERRSAQEAEGPDFVFVITEPAARERAFALASDLRRAGASATLDLGDRSLKGQMKQADRAGARWAVLFVPEEWSRGAVAIRDMRAQEQQELALSGLREALLERAGLAGQGVST